MGLYNDIILPRLCHLSMRNKQLVPYRQRVIGSSRGRVLEIGVGSGLNLPFYGSDVDEVLALEPSPALAGMAHKAKHRDGISVRSLEASDTTEFRAFEIQSISDTSQPVIKYRA